MTTIETNGVVTVGDFLQGAPAGLVVSRSGSEYMVTGRTVLEDGTRHAVLIGLRFLDRLLLPVGMTNDAEIVLNEDGTAKHLDELTRRAIMSMFEATSSLQGQIAQVGRYEADVVVLNEKLNHYAIDQGWCSEYDRIVTKWNEDFQVIELQGRKHPYTVRVRVDAVYYVDVEVDEASDEDDAIEQVNDMYASDIMETYGDWTAPDSDDFSVEHAARSDR